MAKRQRQIGKGKEAPLAVVGYTESESQQRFIIPEDAEYHHYSGLLKGFFEKLTRWQDMLMTYGYQEYMPWRGFSVFRTSYGMSISPETTFNPDVSDGLPVESPNKVLQIGSDFFNRGEHYDPDIAGEHIAFNIVPAPAGEQFFVDPEGKSVGDVFIRVKDNGSLAKLSISTNFLTGKYPSNGVEYQLNRQAQTLKINYSDRKPMPETYQAHLFNTIDSLIPGASGPTPQTRLRTTLEIQTPKALPPAPGRRPGRRA